MRQIRAGDFVAAVAVACLLCSITNFLPLSAALFLLLPLIAFSKEGAPRFVVPLLLLLACAALFTLWDNPESLFDEAFYRRDGNIFVAYAPLVVLPFFRSSINLDRWLKIFLGAALLSNVIALTFWIASGPIDTYNGLFVARNAVGGFLAQMVCLAYAFGRLGRRRYYWVAAALSVALISTYSRGSVLGAGLAIFLCECHLLARFRRWRLVFAYSAFSAMLFSSLYLGYRNMEIYEQTFAHDVEYLADADTGKEANIYIRLYHMWPKAVYCFLRSPFIGIGFGKFDDVPLELDHSIPLVGINLQERVQHTDAHAHNSFLHVLAEQGALGFALLLSFLNGAYRFLDRALSSIRSPAELFLMGAFFSATIAAFTEHRLVTPSMMLPFTLTFGLYLMRRPPDRKASLSV